MIMPYANKLLTEKSGLLRVFFPSCIFMLGLAIRTYVSWPVLTGMQGLVQGDDSHYYRLAISLVNNGELTGEYRSFRMPFFPILLSTTRWWRGELVLHDHAG
jgi:hypothetical protein